MGRLFWKFFLVIWLAQMAAVVGTGVLFWLEHQRQSEHPAFFNGPGPLPQHALPPPPGTFMPEPPPGPPPNGEMRPPPFFIPYAHLGGGLLASLLFAAGLSAYIARPVRRLRRAFEAVAEGALDQRVAEAMGSRRDELADLGRDFDRMTGRLQTLMEGQKRLLHDVSHELRSPLARLHAAIGLMRQRPERLEETIQRIEREGERINRLVGELLTLSRLEAGVSGRVEAVDVAELLDFVAEDARFEANTRQVAVDLSAEPEIIVRANPEMLHRAVENIVRNALRFSPEGGRINITLKAAAQEGCRIEVCDQGPGVLPSLLGNIFDPFFRGEEKQAGTGLGLAIARGAVQAMGGQIEARNRSEGGLCVMIDLPRARSLPDQG